MSHPDPEALLALVRAAFVSVGLGSLPKQKQEDMLVAFISASTAMLYKINPAAAAVAALETMEQVQKQMQKDTV